MRFPSRTFPATVMETLPRLTPYSPLHPRPSSRICPSFAVIVAKSPGNHTGKKLGFHGTNIIIPIKKQRIIRRNIIVRSEIAATGSTDDSACLMTEGTRSKDGKLGAFKKGAFSVAAKTGVPVVPITLLGTGKLMPAQMEGILNPGSVKVVVHQPIEGNDADMLCRESRNVIANALLVHGYGVHGNA